MIAKWFKWPESNWIGLAIAENKKELFQQIDQHGDPYQVVVVDASKGASIVIQMEITYEKDEDEMYEEREPIETEWSEEMPSFESGRWKKISWED